MGKEDFNPFGRPYNFIAPQDQTPNQSMPPHWSTNMQAYYNSGSTSNPFYNPLAASPYMYQQYMWQNQANNALFHRDALNDPARLSNKPHVAKDPALAFSGTARRNVGEGNSDFNKLFIGNSLSLITGDSREYGNPSSAPKNDRDGTSMSVPTGSKRSPGEEQEGTNNVLPLSMTLKPNMIIGDENPSGLTQNLETLVKESDADENADTQLKILEGDDDVRKERKRQSNRESAKRSRMRKQQECEELCKKIDTLKDENSVLTQRLVTLSEECLELTNENNSIEEELVKRYGSESIADLLLMKPV
ncbi:G-box-binding factor 1-like [Vicia villosa]|uniref:G-box-binding factor 1-like n=1 Tax=Vicia villosa TaxID=3911 RepID=UPI00273A93F3|nr:G-box-binding factor 1-like [Vicia villosa]